MDENVLQHYGILGMKWGVRRYQNPDGSLTKAGRKRYDVGEAQKPAAKTAQKATYSRPKSASEMSDEELRAVLNRMNMERQYNEYMKPKPKEISPGRKFVRDVLVNSAKTVATAYVTDKLSSIINGKQDKGGKNKDNSDDDKISKQLKGIQKALNEAKKDKKNNQKNDNKSDDSGDETEKKKGLVASFIESARERSAAAAEARKQAQADNQERFRKEEHQRALRKAAAEFVKSQREKIARENAANSSSNLSKAGQTLVDQLSDISTGNFNSGNWSYEWIYD